MARRTSVFMVALPATILLGLSALLAVPNAEAGGCGANGTDCANSQKDARGCCKSPPPPAPKAKPSVTPSSKPSAPPPPPAQTAWPAPTSCPGGMAGIPGAKYTLGEAKTDAVVLGYCLDSNEVTVSAFKKCVDAKECTEPDPYVKKWGGSEQFCNWKHPEGRGNHPVNCVDSGQADDFCAWRGARLPTEEEWEWAARSGDKASTYPWGDVGPTELRANACGAECPPNGEAKGLKGWRTLYDGEDGYSETAPVGSFPKGDNRWGVHDLAGNVWEWTASKLDPKKPERVNRGGGWDDGSAAALSAARRRAFSPTDRLYNLGFRCAKTP